MNDLKTALLIATYNWPQALDLVLKSVLAQQQLPDEVLIADDGSGTETAELIDNFRKLCPVPLRHFWHEDAGFRKTIILNQAIRHAAADYIIQIDGDIILQPRFIKDHTRYALKKHFIKGSRAMISKERSEQILHEKKITFSPVSAGITSRFNAVRLPALTPLLFGSPQRSDNLRGCNAAFWKTDFMAVNGYNNALLGWGHEDIELAARLVNAGVRYRQLKLAAVCYHIYHKFNPRHNQDTNYQVYEQTVKNNITRCSDGFDQVANYPVVIR